MNKGELINAIKDKASDLPASEVEKIVNATFKTMAETMSNGEGVKFPGFGTFKVEAQKARTGRNPRTGAEIPIPARNVVKFKPAKALKESVS